jgi:RNA polymerase sigma-70 factor (ECF subfamily)
MLAGQRQSVILTPILARPFCARFDALRTGTVPRRFATPEESEELRQQILAAHTGSQPALAWLLEKCRPYLLLIANEEVDPRLRPKLAPSDLVQDSLIEAQRDFAQFRGNKYDDLMAWLRRILVHNLDDARRRFQGAAKRCLGSEQSLDDSKADALHDQLVAADTPPLERAANREREAALDRARQRLPPEYQQVLTLRYHEGRSFADIGAALGKSEEAAKKLWLRAVRRLRSEMKADDGGN